MRWIIPVLAALLFASGAAGQTRDGITPGGDAPEGASALLPADHWALVAVERADALGLVPGFVPAQRTMSRHAAGAALRAAAGNASAGPELASLARGWYERFLGEYPEVGRREEGQEGGLAMQGGAVILGYLDHGGRVAPGQGWWEGERTGARALRDRDGVEGSVRLAASLGSSLAVEVVPSFGPSEIELETVELVGRWRSWRASVGRQPAGYGRARGGAVILSGAVAMDRVEIATERAVRLPGWLRHLGPVAFHSQLSRAPEERHPGSPFFWSASGAFQPHPRLTFSVQRAALFGGDGAVEPITLRNIVVMLIGDVSGLSFEDQIVAVSGRFRLPTEGLIPLTAYLEWGSEDAAGAWFDVPGQVAGLNVPAIPGLPQVEVGVEYARFGGSCCGNPPWYRHGAFPGAWAGVQAPLGHPLGGEGSERLLYAGASLLEGRLEVEGRAFGRDRGAENLFVPGRAGESTGGSARLRWRARPGAELDLELWREAGVGWTEQRIRSGVSIFFGG